MFRTIIKACITTLDYEIENNEELQLITKENFKHTLKHLNFTQGSSDTIYTKYFKELECELQVDFEVKKLIYPKELIVNAETTSNFSSPENFVVFECVNRLLSQGYSPKHIELEKKWQLGHNQKSGKADVYIKDNDDNALLIIECKTAGAEYTKAINILENDSRNQLFSYLQQATSTKFLALYASDFIDDKIIPKYYLINVTDNLELLKNNPKLNSYKDASTATEKYNVWCDTYDKEYATIGLFENNEAYSIGKTKFNIDDLKDINSKDIQGKYHQFATILRQHNVSGRENAFDKLVNLFLCKVTDEIENKDELKFYWKGKAYDNPFDFQDRLQQLYQIGMEKFLEDKIVYIANEKIDEAFGVFKDRPNATKDMIKEFVKELKFFTNNDFAFIDVHNEKLFYQNFEVLLKIAQMIQDIRLTNSEENQFLGDMFESFLDQGVKQSEGQFFTPMPIVKFIINSLPKKQTPKVVDYACGAGHFLNEYTQQNKNATIVGVEKEYRLSKVAKVSSFMYGSDIEIVYADALCLNQKLPNDSFDILIANPPYSVKGFLQTLSQDERDNFELINEVDSKSYSKTGAIECFFIERAKQLLTKDGIAGIIVPSSILNKDTPKLYTKTREILLENFDIVAITEFGSGTFGKTGTNTVTLFLKKISDTINLKQHYKNMINQWFSGDFDTNKFFKDEYILQNYCNYLDINFELYTSFLSGKIEDELLEIEIFKEYNIAFEKLPEIKTRKKKKYYKELAKDDKEQKEKEEFLKYLKKKESEKLLYFALAKKQKNDVVIVRSPTKTETIKKFLGYEWGGRKGNEGIQYLTSTKVEVDIEIDEEDKRVLENLTGLKYINTPLYNPSNSDDNTKINKIIKDNFEGKNIIIPDELKEFVSKANIVDMIDFKRVEFNKAINLNPAKRIEIKSKWELVKIDNIVKNIFAGGDKPKNLSNQKTKAYQIPIYGNGIKDNGLYGYTDIAKVTKECVTVSARGNIGYTVARKEPFYPIVRLIVAVPDESKIKLKFMEIIFNYIGLVGNGAGISQLTVPDIKGQKIPLPPLDIQQKIVSQCEAIDKVNEKLISENKELEKEIEEIVKNSKGNLVSIENILVPIQNDTTKIQKNQILSQGKYPVITQEADKLISGYTDVKNPITDIPLVVFGDHSCTFKYVDFEFIRGADGTQLLKPNERFNIKYFYYVLRFTEIQNKEKYERHMKYLKTNKIPLPPLETQKQIVAKIEKLETQINQNKKIINSAKEKKEEVLGKYL